jgi:hypothetical protein
MERIVRVDIFQGSIVGARVAFSSCESGRCRQLATDRSDCYRRRVIIENTSSCLSRNKTLWDDGSKDIGRLRSDYVSYSAVIARTVVLIVLIKLISIRGLVPILLTCINNHLSKRFMLFLGASFGIIDLGLKLIESVA